MGFLQACQPESMKRRPGRRKVAKDTPQAPGYTGPRSGQRRGWHAGAATQELDTRSSNIPHGQPVTHWKPGVAVSSTWPGATLHGRRRRCGNARDDRAPTLSAAAADASASRWLALPRTPCQHSLPTSTPPSVHASLMFARTTFGQPLRRVRAARRDSPELAQCRTTAVGPQRGPDGAGSRRTTNGGGSLTRESNAPSAYRGTPCSCSARRCTCGGSTGPAGQAEPTDLGCRQSMGSWPTCAPA